MGFYYSELNRYLRDTLAIDRVHISDQVQFAVRHMPNGKDLKVLEIGPCQPHFLNAITERTKSEGYFDEKNLMAAARLEASGYVPFGNSGIFEKFHLIAMCHVFEHIINPVAYLKTLGRHLANDGVIFIEVPDFTRLNWSAQDDFQFEHVNYFSVQSLIKLAQKAGFDVVAYESTFTENYTTCGNQVLRVLFRINNSEYNDVSKNIDGWNKLLERPIKTMFRVCELLSEHKGKIALYGAGTRTTELMAYCKLEDLPNIIFDIDPQKIGEILCGVKVRNPDTVNPKEFEYICIMTLGRENEVADFLKDMGVLDSQIIYLSAIINDSQ